MRHWRLSERRENPLSREDSHKHCVIRQEPVPYLVQIISDDAANLLFFMSGKQLI
jgi:hypothetical protein